MVAQAIDAVRDAISAGVPGVLGIHIEGPFLNAERRGVHDASKLRELDGDAVKLLARPHGGVTMVTLAPERTTPAFIRELSEAGVIVSAGHTSHFRAAAGLRGRAAWLPHLFNAMSPLVPASPARSVRRWRTRSWCGLIVDGHHVHPEVMKIALRASGTTVHAGVRRHAQRRRRSRTSCSMAGRSRSSNRCVDEDGRLAGADLDMARPCATACTCWASSSVRRCAGQR